MCFRISWAVGLLLLFSNPLAAETIPPLPAPVNLDEDAGCHNQLLITVESRNGTDLPFILDTGCPVTILDNSLAPKLGKCLDTTEVLMQPRVQRANCYGAPKLYLGGALLIGGSNVWTLDLSWVSAVTGHRVVGILGMDCLSHYCIQLDFKADQMRFLIPGHLDDANLGKVFPLDLYSTNGDRLYFDHPSIHCPGLLGGTNSIVYIDTGDDSDGEVEKNQIKGHHFIRAASFFTKGVLGVPITVPLKQCIFNGNTYTNLQIGRGSINSLGLSFLARHIATLDFPDRKLYLKQITTGPREQILLVNVPSEVRAAAQLLLDLDTNDELPGWSRTDRGTASIPAGSKYGRAILADLVVRIPLKSVTINFQKRGDSTVYRYMVSRWSTQSNWLLQRAWQEDSHGKIIKEFPIPFPAFPPDNSPKTRSTFRYF